MNPTIRVTIVGLVLSALLCSILLPVGSGEKRSRGAASAQTFVFGPETYVRGTGKPSAEIRTFSVVNPGAEFTLVVRNERDASKVGNIIIELNGVRIVNHKDSNRRVAQLSVPVTLQPFNTISVTLNGAPATTLSVSIVAGTIVAGPPIFTLLSNASDPLLFQAETTAGEVIEYFGERDEKGFAASLYSVRVHAASGDITTFALDETGRISQIHAANGAVFNITWVSETSIVITTIAADGSVRYDLPIDLTTLQSNHSNNLKPFESRGRNRSSAVRHHAVHRFQAGSSSSLISVTRCGAPVNNADVKLDVRNPLNDPLNLQARLIGGGLYTVSIPNVESNPIRRGREACERTAKQIGFGCDALSLLGPAFTFGICPLLSVGLAAIPGGAIVVPAFFIACQSAAAAATLYCRTLGYSPQIGAPSVAEYVCKSIAKIADRAIKSTSTLFVTARIPGVPEIFEDVKSAPARGPFPNFNIAAACPAQCQGGLGGRVFSNGHSTQVTILPAEADFTNEIYLLSPGTPRFLGTNQDAGTVVNLGSFPIGTELVFGIVVRDTQQTFKTGFGSRNPDGIPHAIIQCLGGGNIRVGFEDKINSDDIDHDDAVIRVSAP